MIRVRGIGSHRSSPGNTDSDAYGKASDEFYNRHDCRFGPYPGFEFEFDEIINHAKQLAVWVPLSMRCPPRNDYPFTLRTALYPIVDLTGLSPD